MIKKYLFNIYLMFIINIKKILFYKVQINKKQIGIK